LLAIEKVDVNTKDNGGRTPLLYAIKYGRKSVVQLLLATNKVDVNTKARYS
jgi:ankyrin repeat protein